MNNESVFHRGMALIHTIKRFFVNLVQDFISHGCQKSAAALTYMTLFAIVPLMTLMFAIFSVVPAFNGVAEQSQELIFSHFIPETGQEIQSYISGFSSQARSLSGFGVVMLVVTAYLMLTNIEKTLNAIWGVQRGRKGLSSFLLYWAVLSIGPILLGAGLAMNTYLLSLKLLVSEYDALGVGSMLFRSLPMLFTSAAFTLLFVAVPNCRVPMRFAIIGGITTALCFELLKSLFSTLVANSSFQLIYGAFAVVPLFLLWVNLVWIVILAGAILVRTLAERRYTIVDGEETDMVAALKCLALFRTRNQLGEAVSDTDCYRLGLGVVHWQKLRAQFERKKWISETSTGRYVLCRDLRTINLWGLADLVGLKLHELKTKVANPPQTQWFDEYLKRREQVVQLSQESLSISIESVLKGGEGECSDVQMKSIDNNSDKS